MEKKKEIHIHPRWKKELVVGNTTFRSAFDFHLSEADLEKSRRKLNETEEVREASLRKLKEMLSEDADIRYRMDDAYLVRYLRHRKFNIKEAYERIRKFYLTRNENPQLFSVSLDMRSKMNIKFLNMLPYTDEEGSPIFLHKWGNWNTQELTTHDLLNLFIFVSDITNINPHAQVNAVIAIEDCRNLNISHSYKMFHPSTIRLFAKILQDLYPWRIRRVILFNCNAFVYAGLGSIRRVMKKKIADRIVCLRSDLTQLHQYVNPVLLPKEYGGSLEDDECYKYINQPILENIEYLKYENSFIDAQKK